jgi:hypothetical protein
VAKEKLDIVIQVSLFLIEEKGTCSGQGRTGHVDTGQSFTEYNTYYYILLQVSSY